MLERHVHVTSDLWAFRDGSDEIVCPMGRVGIEKSDPEVAGDLVQISEEGREGGGVDGESLGSGLEAGRGRDGS
jgi:hypothetical protein